MLKSFVYQKYKNILKLIDKKGIINIRSKNKCFNLSKQKLDKKIMVVT